MGKIGSQWKKEILGRNKKLSSKDEFVKEYVGKIKKKEEMKTKKKTKKKSKVSFPRQSNVNLSRTPRVRKGLGPKPIRL